MAKHRKSKKTEDVLSKIKTFFDTEDEGTDDIAANTEENQLLDGKKKCFVGVFDIIGFRNLMLTKDPSWLRSKYQSLLSTLREDDRVRVTAYSDSIFVYSKGGELEHVREFIEYCRFLYETALDADLLLKGALSYGELFLLENIIFGFPVVDAYELQDQMKLSSIVLHHTFEDRVTELFGLGIKEEFISYETQLKSCRVSHNHIYYTSRLREVFTVKLNSFYLRTSGEHRLYLDNSVKFYARNAE